jgi:adenylate kinase family enzyme
MKLLVIGCPGSGKSTLSKRLSNKYNVPVLHLDVLKHIDNNTRISRDELVQKINEFVNNNDSWIIDGNYMSTLDFRLGLCDKVILLDIGTEECLKNVFLRSESNEIRDDIALGFDNSILDDDFIDFIKNYNTVSLPIVEELLKKHKKQVIRLESYDEIDQLTL